MVFFKDFLETPADFSVDANTQLAHIQHYLSDFEHGVLVMSDPSLCSEIDDPSELWQSKPLKLSVRTSDNSVSDLLPYASVELSHNGPSELKTPVEFVRRYQDILAGRHPGWLLHAAEAYSNTIFLHYVNVGHDAIGKIILVNCPIPLWLDVPEPQPRESEEKTRGLWYVFGKREPEVSHNPAKIHPVAIRYSDPDTMTIWTGDNLRPEGLSPDELLPGQRMLQITLNDEDGDCEIERIYHQSDLRSDEALLEHLQSIENRIFVL